MALLSRAPARLLRAVLLCCVWSTAWAAPPTEYDIKAAFLFHFAQFVGWPAASFAGASAPFVIGVIGEDPFGQVLADTVRGETINQHPFIVTHFQDPAQVTYCNILFVGPMEPKRASDIVAALGRRSILTVSDADVPGAIVELVTQRSHVRLRINLAAAKAAGLQISSTLLQAATVVDGGG